MLQKRFTRFIPFFIILFNLTFESLGLCEIRKITDEIQKVTQQIQELKVGNQKHKELEVQENYLELLHSFQARAISEIESEWTDAYRTVFRKLTYLISSEIQPQSLYDLVSVQFQPTAERLSQAKLKGDEPSFPVHWVENSTSAQPTSFEIRFHNREKKLASQRIELGTWKTSIILAPNFEHPHYFQTEFNILSILSSILSEEEKTGFVRNMSIKPTEIIQTAYTEDCFTSYMKGRWMLLPFEKKIELYFQAVRAVVALHRREIAHGDLKLENLLVPSDEVTGLPTELVVADFDTTFYPRDEIKQNKKEYFRGTLGYTAPSELESTIDNRFEKWKGRDLNEKVENALKNDVFSLGVIGQFLLLDRVPLWLNSDLYFKLSEIKDYRSYLRLFRVELQTFIHTAIETSHQPTEPNLKFKSILKSILDAAMTDDPQQRVTSSELLRQLEEVRALLLKQIAPYTF